MDKDTLSAIFSTLLMLLAIPFHLKALNAKDITEKLTNMQYCNWLLAFAILAKF